MTKELPITIAPDGVVIQIAQVSTSDEYELPTVVACPKCYMEKQCQSNDSINPCADITKMLGYRCSDYDDYGLIGYWEKVDPE